MKAVYLHVVEQAVITGASLMRIIHFINSRDWLDSPDDPGKTPRLQYATELAGEEGIIAPNMAFVNCGYVRDMVLDVEEIDVGEKRGLLVSVPLKHPSLFYLQDGAIRFPHLRFDFAPYVDLMFTGNDLRVLNLTDTDKTLLRLTHNTVKGVRGDGEMGERLRK